MGDVAEVLGIATATLEGVVAIGAGFVDSSLIGSSLVGSSLVGSSLAGLANSSFADTAFDVDVLAAAVLGP